MVHDHTQRVGAFLEAAAARQPTPGGGAVTALVGALSASMGEMVLNYSIDKKDLEAFRGELEPILAELKRARAMLTQLMVEDQLAYEALTRLRKLPMDDPERAGSVDAALLAAIRAPQTMAATAAAVLEMADRAVNFVNFHLLSDLAVCGDLAMAATRCAIYSVRVNLADVVDAEDRRHIELQMNGILGRAASVIQRVIPRIWDRQSSGV